MNVFHSLLAFVLVPPRETVRVRVQKNRNNSDLKKNAVYRISTLALVPYPEKQREKECKTERNTS